MLATLAGFFCLLVSGLRRLTLAGQAVDGQRDAANVFPLAHARHAERRYRAR